MSGGWSWGGGGDKKDSKRQQSQFVKRSDQYQSLPDDKKKYFKKFEEDVIQRANKQQRQVSDVIKTLEQLPDITPILKTYFDRIQLLLEKIDHYQHELQPFYEELKKEFAHANQIEVNLQRSSLSNDSIDIPLPPPFYWEKVVSFQQQMNLMAKNIRDLQQHISDIENSREISPQGVINALQASYRGTLHVASQVINFHNEVQLLKQAYRKYRADRYGDTSDPFYKTSKEREYSMDRLQEYVDNQTKTLELSGLQDFSKKVTGQQQSSSSSSWGTSSGNGSGSGSGSSWSWGGGSSSDKDKKDKDKKGSSASSYSWGGGGSSSSNTSGSGSGSGSGFSWDNKSGSGGSGSSSGSSSGSGGFSWGGSGSSGSGSGSSQSQSSDPKKFDGFSLDGNKNSSSDSGGGGGFSFQFGDKNSSWTASSSSFTS